MKRILLSLIVAVFATSVVWADDYNYLTVVSSNMEQSFALKQVRRITFNGTEMIVTTTDGNSSSVALSTLNKIGFTATATAIRNLSTENCRTMQLQSDRVVVAGSGLLKLYNSQGALVRQIVVNGNRAELNLEGLPHGIYIARLGTQSLKVAH